MAKFVLHPGRRYIRRNGTISQPLIQCGKFLKDPSSEMLYDRASRHIAYVFDRTNPNPLDLLNEYIENNS